MGGYRRQSYREGPQSEQVHNRRWTVDGTGGEVGKPPQHRQMTMFVVVEKGKASLLLGSGHVVAG